MIRKEVLLMKDIYTKPISEIEKFKQVEILTLSGTEEGEVEI